MPSSSTGSPESARITRALEPTATALARHGLRLGTVDPTDDAALDAWIEVDSRGFHLPRPAESERPITRDVFRERRTQGVWDTAVPGDAPVATSSSWASALAVGGGARVPIRAVSSITVSPTHRRRGLARQIIGAELAVAHADGVPVVAITVSEPTIYRRYGFGPTADSVTLTIDTRRAALATGSPETDHRASFLTGAAVFAAAQRVHHAACARRAGEIPLTDPELRQLLGLAAPDDAESRTTRAVHLSAPGSDAIVVYRPRKPHTGPAELEIPLLAATDDAAERAAWRFAVSLDFVSSLTAPLRPVDDVLPLLLADPWAVAAAERRDHLWTRILDPIAALAALPGLGTARLGLRIADPLGFAAPTVLIAGDGSVEAIAELPTDAPVLELGIDDLASLWLGGYSATALAAAGRIGSSGDNALSAADALFRGGRAPVLSTWF